MKNKKFGSVILIFQEIELFGPKKFSENFPSSKNKKKHSQKSYYI